MPETITQTDLDKLAEILWWIKGYIAGARDNLEESPFVHSHVESLRRARVILKPIVEEQETKGD